MMNDMAHYDVASNIWQVLPLRYANRNPAVNTSPAPVVSTTGTRTPGAMPLRPARRVTENKHSTEVRA